MNVVVQFALRQIDDPNLSRTQRAQLRCKLARELEEAGDYEAARQALGELWQQTGTRPALDELDDVVSAEVLLRAGSLTGWLGSVHQIERAQEVAKDLISESAALFESLQETEKVAEAYVSLATCYWREGALDEARVTLQEALKRLGETSSEQKAKALLSAALVETSAERLSEALRLLMEAGPYFEQYRNHVALGRFHGQIAVVLRKLGMSEQRTDYIDRALLESEAASYHFEQAGHHRYRARIENNLGYLLQRLGRFTEAHEHLDRAVRLFTNLRDHGSIAQVNDTRARVFLAQGRNTEAERVVRAAVRTLEKGDELSLLAEALTTHGVALARLGRGEEAHHALERAGETAARAGDPQRAGVAAITIMEELCERLAEDELRAVYESADELLKNSNNSETLNRLRACARRVLTSERSAPGSEFETQSFIYADERTAELLRAAHLIAGTQGAVLITGETGTGKEVLARLVHEWSGRTGPFISINCGALAETRIESALFGHRRGSFPEAIEDQEGAVRRAVGGTLFLDRITELSPGNQGKLLRLIEHGEAHSIGASEPERVDVRVVASADCDLKKRAAEGSFREDLLYRLNTFHLVIPPLRERRDDIPRLATHFVKEFTRLYRKRVRFVPEAIASMRELELPGNVRELRSLIERTVLLADDGASITESAVKTFAAMHSSLDGTLSDVWESFSLRDEVLNFESQLIRLALEASGGSVTHAARLLGISHQRLGSMLEGRHKNLLLARKPAQPRKRSIISRLQRS